MAKTVRNYCDIVLNVIKDQMINSTVLVGGSLGLKLQRWETSEPHDLDLVMADTPNVRVWLAGMAVMYPSNAHKNYPVTKDAHRYSFKFDEVDVDVFLLGKDLWEVTYNRSLYLENEKLRVEHAQDILLRKAAMRREKDKKWFESYLHIDFERPTISTHKPKPGSFMSISDKKQESLKDCWEQDTRKEARMKEFSRDFYGELNGCKDDNGKIDELKLMRLIMNWNITSKWNDPTYLCTMYLTSAEWFMGQYTFILQEDGDGCKVSILRMLPE